MRARARAVEFTWLAGGHCARARGDDVFGSGALHCGTAARRPIHSSGECLTDTRVFTLVLG